MVKWAKERIDEFNEGLERQLSSVEPGSSLWNECIQVVKQQSNVLQEVAVDFSGLVATGLTVDDQDHNHNNDDAHLATTNTTELSLRSRDGPIGLGLSR